MAMSCFTASYFSSKPVAATTLLRHFYSAAFALASGGQTCTLLVPSTNGRLKISKWRNAILREALGFLCEALYAAPFARCCPTLCPPAESIPDGPSASHTDKLMLWGAKPLSA